MSFWKFLGLEPRTASRSDRDTETVRRIARELEALEPARARYLAAFAFILSRVAYADSQVSAAETSSMERIVEQYGQLSPAQASLVVEIAKAQANLFGATEDFLVSRQFRDASTASEREELLHCLFAVSAADDSISSVEETLARQIASEIGVSDRDFLAIRSRYSDKRQVLKDLPGGTA
jgi:uncharacterized tellurite resistance protein B-like protein